MPFERQSLQGPKNVAIQGPEEHIGESRYHWLEKVDKLGRLKSGRIGIVGQNTRMLLRIEKESGRNKDYDCFSPIVGLQFTPLGLWIGLSKPKTLKNNEFREAINPYTNTIARNTPSFLIEYGHWHQHYTVNYKTNVWGDFLVFEGQSSGKDSEKRPRHLLMVNLWAVFALEGLGRVKSNGVLVFDSKPIGRVPTRGGQCLPFFADISVKNPTFSNIEGSFKSFQKQSAERVFGIVRPTDGDSSPRIFSVIGECVYGDRPSTTPVRGMQWAKETFAKLFPEAV